MAILVLSIGLDTFQEGRAVKAAEVLRRSVALKAEVKRDGAFVPVEVDTVVPGDVIRVRGGDIIPADALVLEATAFTTSEAALTGEPYPVEKRPGIVTARNSRARPAMPCSAAPSPRPARLGAGCRHGPRDPVRRCRLVARRKPGAFALSARPALVRPADRAPHHRAGPGRADPRTFFSAVRYSNR